MRTTQSTYSHIICFWRWKWFDIVVVFFVKETFVVRILCCLVRDRQRLAFGPAPSSSWQDPSLRSLRDLRETPCVRALVLACPGLLATQSAPTEQRYHGSCYAAVSLATAEQVCRRNKSAAQAPPHAGRHFIGSYRSSVPQPEGKKHRGGPSRLATTTGGDDGLAVPWTPTMQIPAATLRKRIS